MGSLPAHEIYVEIPHCVCYTFPMDNMQGERSFIQRGLRKGQTPPREVLMETETAARNRIIAYDADCPPTSAREFERIDRVLAERKASHTRSGASEHPSVHVI